MLLWTFGFLINGKELGVDDGVDVMSAKHGDGLFSRDKDNIPTSGEADESFLMG